MWWYGRGNSGGSWLPEEKKANMWPDRGNSGGSWPLPFPTPQTSYNLEKIELFRLNFEYL